MNTILQKRIEEASIEYTMRTRPMCIAGGAFADMAREFNKNPDFIAGATFALQNQWISVEEALPDVGDECFVIWAESKLFGVAEIYPNHEFYVDGFGFTNIDYWMPVPTLKGDEK